MKGMIPMKTVSMRAMAILIGIFAQSACLAEMQTYGEGSCGVPLEGCGWIECEGSGKTKPEAISEALKQGISMVYGEVMSAEDIAKMRATESMVKTPTGSASVQTGTESFESSMHTKTAGRVREYKIISLKPEPDGFCAHVHARIINPRSGIGAVILVAPTEAIIQNRTTLYDVGPKQRLSGAEIAKKVEKAICTALSLSKSFRVCTFDDIAATVANNKLTGSLVKEGMVPSSELLEANQMLTTDYILTSRFEDVKYKKTLGQNKTTKKFGTVYSFKVKLSFQLTDVRTGTTAGCDTVTFSLDDAEIREMLEEDEDADLLQGAFRGMIKPLLEWIKKRAK